MSLFKNKEKANNPRPQLTKEKTTLNQRSKRGVKIGKRMLSILTSAGIILICFFIASTLLNKQASKITIVGLLNDCGPGTLITEAHMMPIDVVFEDYTNLGTQTWELSNGETTTEQVFVEWEERNKLKDQFLTYFQYGQSPLTTRMVTPDLLIRSAWLKEVPNGMEVYTMPFTVSDIYSPVFFPGSHVRIRLVYEVDIESVAEVKQKIAEKERRIAAGQYVANGESIIMESIRTSPAQQNGFGTGMDKKTAPVAEPIFEDIVIVDMLNASNESVFDLYLELLGMPVNKRMEMLKTTLEGTNSQEFKQKVTPSQLVFVVTREEATNLCEFEEISASLKYTLLPQQETDYDLMTQFTEIGNQIQSFLDNSAVASFK